MRVVEDERPATARRSWSRRRATSRATRRWSGGCSAARSAGSRTSSSSTTRRTTRIGSGRTQPRRGDEDARRSTRRPSRSSAGGDGLDRRSRPHPQAARHQLLRRSLGDAVSTSRARAADTNRIFPWVVSDFGLTDAIESGLVKIPQLAVSDPTGEDRAAYFNIWRWIMGKLTARRARRQAREPEAGGGAEVRANTPIEMLGGALGGAARGVGARRGRPRPPGLHPRLQEHKLAKVVHEWLADGQAADGVPPADLPELRNADGASEHDPRRLEGRRGDRRRGREDRRAAWMRHTLDTVGQARLAARRSGAARSIQKGSRSSRRSSSRPLHPPGRDVRCIVSRRDADRGLGLQHRHAHRRAAAVHVAAPLRAGRRARAAARRATRSARTASSPRRSRRCSASRSRSSRSSSPSDAKPPRSRSSITCRRCPRRREYEITFPRVEGYQQAIRNRVAVDWDADRAGRGRPDGDPGRGR